MKKNWGVLIVFLVLVLGTLEFVPAPPIDCYGDADCGPGWECNGPPYPGICEPMSLANGALCTSNIECASAKCNIDIDGSNRYCTASDRQCGDAGSQGYYTGNIKGAGICTGEDSRVICTSSTICDTYSGNYCDGDSWESGYGTSFVCDTGDFCSGVIYYDGKTCNGGVGTGGACTEPSGVIAPDSSSAACYCSSSGYTWMPSLGSMFGDYPSCCGDDGYNDDFTTYSGSEFTSQTLSCERCRDGFAADWIFHGNGWYSGDLASSTSLECYYGDIKCNAPYYSERDGDHITLNGNGWYSGSLTTSTSLTCYYGDMSCGDGTYSSGSSATRYGNGYLSGSGTSRTCYHGDIGCWNGGSANGNSMTIYGWGYYTGSLTTSTTVDCRSGAGTCGDGTYASDSITTLLGNGYISGSTCYYGDITCSSGSEANGATCTLDANDICGDLTACFDCTTTGYLRASTTACKTSCTADTDCASGYHCEMGSCVDTSAKQFLIQTASGGCMRIEDDGDVIFGGTTAYGQGTLTAPAGSFQLKDNVGNVVFYVDSSCNMKTKGSLYTGQTGLSFVDDNSFYIKNSGGTYVFKINSAGNIYARGVEK